MTSSSRGVRRGTRTAIAGALLASLVGTIIIGATEESGASALPRTPACTSSGLVEWLNTEPNGAAGTIYYNLQFTNLSGHVCTLRGYPGVSGISLGGAQLGSAAERSPGTPVRTISVGVGETATSALGIVEVGNFTRSACHPTTAAGLRIYAPNQTVAKTIPFPFGACAKSGEIYLSVQAVK